MAATKKPTPKKGAIMTFLCDSASDWVSWANKLKWHFISFKFLAFFGFCGLLVLLWYGLERAFSKTVEIATALHASGHIEEEHVTKIVTTAQTVYYDNVIGHVSLLAAAVLVAIIGLKMISEKVEGDISKATGKAAKDLKNFMKKND